MRWRVYLVISLLLNCLLAAGWLLSLRAERQRFNRIALGLETNAPVVTKTNVLVRRQFFTWQEVESDDYPTYIANLRDIGCPEQTIRDIIIADVNALYAKRRATEVEMPEQQWWRTEPDTNVMQIAAGKIAELETERIDLLTRLLGPGWESGDLVSLPRPSRAPIPLDGPVLGLLPKDVKLQVEEISVRTQTRIQTYLDEQRLAGRPADLAELARMRQQTRVELAAVLTPYQLEEFLLRYSQNATDLRAELGQLKYFNASSNEFRAMFRATDGFDQQLELLGDANDPNTGSARRALEQQRLDALKNLLGPERFQEYQLLHDPLYRSAYAEALKAGTPETALTLYQINQAATQQTANIRANTNLTAEVQAVELKKAELEQLEAIARAMGQELPAEPPAPPKPPPAKVHVLKPGEGLDFLSRLYAVNPGDLRAANPNVDFSNLKPGVSIKVPINLLPPVPYLPPQ